ncbi:MAG: hypothetical protein HUJ63_12275 [Enterococcus sp.]|nr:hypothetical protein [Enterococcus sp.]
MMQRVKMAGPVGFYKRETKFYRYAYSKPSGLSDYNMFMRMNMEVAPYLTKQQVTQNAVVPAPFIISNGILNAIKIEAVEWDAGRTELETRTSLKCDQNTTCKEIRQQMNLNIGAMITFVWFGVTVAGDREFFRAKEQIIFKAEKENQTFVSQFSQEISLDFEVGKLLLSFNSFGEINPSVFCIGAGCIVTEKRTTIESSDAQLCLNKDALQGYLEFRSDTQRDLAMMSYGNEQEATLSPSYTEYETSNEILVGIEKDLWGAKKGELFTFLADESVNFYYNPNDVIGVDNVEGKMLEGVIFDEMILNKNTNSLEIVMPNTTGENLWEIKFKKGDSILAKAYIRTRII